MQITVINNTSYSHNDAPDWIRTSTPKKAQALNLPRMPIPPPGLANYYTPLAPLVNPASQPDHADRPSRCRSEAPSSPHCSQAPSPGASHAKHRLAWAAPEMGTASILCELLTHVRI